MTNSVTYYYRRKEDLAAACFLHTIAMLDGLAARAEAEPDPAARLRRFLALYLAGRAAVARGEEPDTAMLNDVRALRSPRPRRCSRPMPTSSAGSAGCSTARRWSAPSATPARTCCSR